MCKGEHVGKHEQTCLRKQKQADAGYQDTGEAILYQHYEEIL